MPERVDWLDDGSACGDPYNPRFGDRYRSEAGGIAQSREVFLKGCGLPAAWAEKPAWCILETGFGLGLNFLVTWQAWRKDPLRPRMLHFVSTEAFPASPADVIRSASAHPELAVLAANLAGQLWGLLPGFHRLALENGYVLLTLCIGDANKMLQQQHFEADSVYLDGFSPAVNPDIWDIHTFKAVARCCRRGTRVATWTVARSVIDALGQAGFVVGKTPGQAPKRDNLQGEYNPHWKPKRATGTAASPKRVAGQCVIIGSGLAGAAAAASLQRRGWSVMVLDAGAAPAAAASGLPAGLLAPHVSPDDSVLSRLSRCGFRATFEQLAALSAEKLTSSMKGVLELSRSDADTTSGNPHRAPASWSGQWLEAAEDWSRKATADELNACGLLAHASALWHARAGWIKPAGLVTHWLSGAGIEWRGDAKVTQITPGQQGWEAVGEHGEVFAQADLVVIAGGFGSRALASSLISDSIDASHAINVESVKQLQAVRGQISYGTQGKHELSSGEHCFPVNGHGSFIPNVPMADTHLWLAGSTFQRNVASSQVELPDHDANLERLAGLLPQTARELSPEFAAGAVRGWAGVRCTRPARLPLVCQIASCEVGEVWISTSMGSRGLTFAALCGEILAAQLHGEPLPLERNLLQALQPTKSGKS